MDTFRNEDLAAVLARIDVNSTGFPTLLIGNALLLREVRDGVVAMGGRVVGETDWATVTGTWTPPAATSLFVLDARGVAEEHLAAALPRVVAAAGAVDAPVIVSIDRPAIDLAAAVAFGPATQILCEPEPADQALALTLAARSIDAVGLHDNRAYENEAARLHRLNEEVARIAEILSRLSQRGADQRPHATDVLDRRQSFEIKPIHDITIDAGEIRRAIKGRRLRDQFFGAGLFEEPGWDCLLDLFAAELEGTRVSVSSLCIAAAVAPTTALRWISKLTEAGLLERRPDPFDRRRAYMELSERASGAMRDYIAAMRRAGLSLA